jgi:hypothetical protein
MDRVGQRHSKEGLLSRTLAIIAVLAAAVGLAAASGALGQSGDGAVISPEQRSTVRQYVQRERRAQATLPEGYQLAIGATLPVDIELYMFPEQIGLRQYRYTTVGARTVLVEPGTRRIIQIVE